MQQQSKCCRCGGIVDAFSSRGIRLMFCCGLCYTDLNAEVSGSEARSRYGCTEADLSLLHWRDPSPKKCTGKRQYVKVEVEFLGRLRLGRKQWTERPKRKVNQTALAMKRIRLENSSHVKLEQVRVDLRPFVIGDYLTRAKGTRINRKTVCSRLAAHKRAAEIIDHCQADPLTALDFCVDYPNGGPSEFIDLRERMRRVFRLEGARILHKVPPSERSNLAQTPLSDVYEEFTRRDSFQYILHYLSRETNTDTAVQILGDQACQAAVEKGGDEEEIAKKLLEFWREKNNTKKRKEKLERALKQRQLTMPTDQVHYQAYVLGTVCQDVDEVIALAEFSQRLKKRGIAPWGKIFDKNCSAVVKHMNDQQLSIDEAVNMAMKTVPMNPRF